MERQYVEMFDCFYILFFSKDAWLYGKRTYRQNLKCVNTVGKAAADYGRKWYSNVSCTG